MTDEMLGLGESSLHIAGKSERHFADTKQQHHQRIEGLGGGDSSLWWAHPRPQGPRLKVLDSHNTVEDVVMKEQHIVKCPV